MVSLDEQLAEVKLEEAKILKKIDQRNAKRKIKCDGCDKLHEIGTLKAIQTHWYVPPHGCTGGDYWKEGELQFVCPSTNLVNRLLFNNHDVPYEEREKYANDPELQFKRNYKSLFLEVVDEHDEKSNYGARTGTNGSHTNNFYVDENRKKFNLVEKRKANQN